MLSIDTFTGQLFLSDRSFIDKENPTTGAIDVEVNVEASDGVHTTQGQFLIHFEDSSRTCKPTFKNKLYRQQCLCRFGSRLCPFRNVFFFKG